MGAPRVLGPRGLGVSSRRRTRESTACDRGGFGIGLFGLCEDAEPTTKHSTHTGRHPNCGSSGSELRAELRQGVHARERVVIGRSVFGATAARFSEKQTRARGTRPLPWSHRPRRSSVTQKWRGDCERPGEFTRCKTTDPSDAPAGVAEPRLVPEALHGPALIQALFDVWQEGIRGRRSPATEGAPAAPRPIECRNGVSAV